QVRERVEQQSGADHRLHAGGGLRAGPCPGVYHGGVSRPSGDGAHQRAPGKPPNPESRTPKPGSRNLDPKTWIPKPESRNPDPETWIPKPGYRNPDPETRIPKP
ncbi:hypothetical protein T484DRAFT_3645504, partial [Baffinella frigidus]